MKQEKIHIGNNIYQAIKKNNTAVWAMAVFSLAISSVSLFLVAKAYDNTRQNLYAISDTGAMVPLKRLDQKKDRLKQVMANMDYFVSLYYDLDGYTIADKKEKVFWLVGDQPTTIIKDRDNKGYFNSFLSITGMSQHAKIIPSSFSFSGYDAPYDVTFTVNLVRTNGNNQQYYKVDVKATLDNVNINYPYNPYGLIITYLSESLTESSKEEQKNDI